MTKNLERKWRSKVTEGLRVQIPKDIADMYKMKKGDIVEWTYSGKGNIMKIAIKEMVLREKEAEVEKEKDPDVDATSGGPAVGTSGEMKQTKNATR